MTISIKIELSPRRHDRGGKNLLFTGTPAPLFSHISQGGLIRQPSPSERDPSNSGFCSRFGTYPRHMLRIVSITRD